LRYKDIDTILDVKVESTGEESVSLLTDCSLEHLLPETTALEAGIVSWSPPNPNWNPWKGANIDEGENGAYRTYYAFN
jgi:ATP-dependent RNA helicase A